jgi:hypothetical protein
MIYAGMLLGTFVGAFVVYPLLQALFVFVLSTRRTGSFKLFRTLSKHEQDLITLGVVDELPALTSGFNRKAFMKGAL